MSQNHLLEEMTNKEDVVPPEAEIEAEADSTKTHNMIAPYKYLTWKQPLLPEEVQAHHELPRIYHPDQHSHFIDTDGHSGNQVLYGGPYPLPCVVYT